MKTKMRQQHNVIRNRNICKIIFSGNVMDVTIQPSRTKCLASTEKDGISLSYITRSTAIEMNVNELMY